MSEQIPFLPVRLQLLHSPVHDSLQQTPSAQDPLAQSSFFVQALPAPGTHAPAPSQTPLVHAVPAAVGVETWAPALHATVAHAAVATSVSSATVRVVPSALHTMRLQSPATCAAIGVPSGEAVVSQRPATQWLVWQGPAALH